MLPIDFKQVTTRVQEQLKQGVYRRLQGHEQIAIQATKRPLTRGTVLAIGPNRYTVDRDAYLVFIDLVSEANFAHPVMYELHDVKDGSVKTIHEQFPLADPKLSQQLVSVITPQEGRN